MVVMILIIGLTVVTTHNIRVAGWPVIITLCGWILMFKSLTCLLFPRLMTRFIPWAGDHIARWIRVAGALTWCIKI